MVCHGLFIKTQGFRPKNNILNSLWGMILFPAKEEILEKNVILPVKIGFSMQF